MGKDKNEFVAWAFSLMAQVLIFKNLIVFQEIEKISANGHIGKFKIIIPAHPIPWFISLLIAVWTLLLAQRYNKQMERLKLSGNVVFLVFLIIIICLTISALLLLDYTIGLRPAFSYALVPIGIAYMIIVGMDVYNYRPTFQSGKDAISAFNKQEKLSNIININSTKAALGILFLVLPFSPFSNFSNDVKYIFQGLIAFLIGGIIIYELIISAKDL
ncbi:MAG: hypothetical protein GYA36_22655 [Veillonellaceae bacterium]|nr:hypothetical protein [Veillonellaceae bacterium]